MKITLVTVISLISLVITTVSWSAPLPRADVTKVQTTLGPDGYKFAVTIQSSDIGCEQYANWWEVLSADGKLIYRRILTHSHVAEQPFTRSGGRVIIKATDPIIIRAHMHPFGYMGRVLKGSIEKGFKSTLLNSGFAKGVEKPTSQTSYCAW